MKKILSLAIACQILLSSCEHTRFKTYRIISVNVNDKKIPEMQAKYYQKVQNLKSMYDIAVNKSSNGEKSTDAESYDSMMYLIELRNNSVEFHPPDYILPSEMNPDWIEVTQDYIVFEDKLKKEVKKFKIESINKQEGIDDADWIIKIDDSEIEQAFLSNGVLQLKSGFKGRNDYAYKFYTKSN